MPNPPFGMLTRGLRSTQTEAFKEVFLYLVDSLPHEVFLHGDVVANELLHGATQQTVVEELIQVFLMLWNTRETHQQGPRARRQLHQVPLLPV